ncbi:hypothetical protein G6F63_014656 [Rhizopus arrhizus]|nr:hypothetical protein G6F63_014656 [Rhizopus arrhizus]
MLSSMNTRSSVTMLPDAPGAKGHPPRPPRQESKLRMPSFTPASALARPNPMVSCRCSLPTVSASAISSTQVRATAAATNATRRTGTSPSLAHPTAVATAASMRMGRGCDRTQLTIDAIISTCASVPLPTLAWLWVSLTEIGNDSTCAPAS